jgi:acetyltransferase-like isoleucine patch superfamily enzyme
VLFAPRLFRKCANLLAGVLSTAMHRLAVRNVGPGTRFERGVWVHDPSAVSFGARCYIGRGVVMGTETPGAALSVGDGVEINTGANIDYSGGLEIGDGVLISEEALIYTHDHGLDPRSVPTLYRKQIGAGAWIGARVILMPKCRYIGTRAVVGAGAVVTKDVPDFAIVAGNPARVVGATRSGRAPTQSVSA